MDKEYIIYKRKCKKAKWCVRICCQGQPFYYLYRTLIGAFISYAYNYYKKHKYGTMTFKLIEYKENVSLTDQMAKAEIKAESEEHTCRKERK